MVDPETSTNQMQEKDKEIAKLKAQLEELMRKLNTHEDSYKDEDAYSVRTFYNAGQKFRNFQYKPKLHVPPKDDIKVDIPEFHGKIDCDEFQEWILNVERVFDYKEVSDEKKVKLVALKLRKYASDWWENLQKKRLRKGKEKVRTWEKMKKKMAKKFMPQTYLLDKFATFHHLEQGNLSVFEYAREFENLIMKCDLKENDVQTLVRFLGGLNVDIKNVVELYPFTSLSDLIQLAHKVEKQNKGKGKWTSRPNTQKPHSNSLQIKEPQSSPSKDVTPPLSNTTTQSSQSKPQPRRCYKCQGLGHISLDCPNKRTITLMEYEEGVEEKEHKEELMPLDVEGGEEIGPDVGECLMVRRSLSVHEVPMDQRESIFHTKCTIAAKVCTLIVDSGSCANVASQTFVDKLNFKVVHHPKPYMIQWLNHDKGINVTKRVFLSFSIGSYMEQLWCDIVPMDASHVLLGRPWQYDRRTIHDGYKNTYSFVKDDKKITLAPYVHHANSKSPKMSNLFSSSCIRYNSPNVSNNLLIDKGELKMNYGEGDLVWLDLGASMNKKWHDFDMAPMLDGPYKVIGMVNNFSCKVDINGVQATMRNEVLLPYNDDGDLMPSLRTSFFKGGENDSHAMEHKLETAHFTSF